jgi:hypothetical protein
VLPAPELLLSAYQMHSAAAGSVIMVVMNNVVAMVKNVRLGTTLLIRTLA